ERRGLQSALADLLGRGVEVEASRLLQEEMLVDQAVERLLPQAEGLDGLGGEVLAIDLLVLLLHVDQLALVLARRDRLPVHPRDVGAVVARAAAGTAGTPVDEDEEDEDRHDGDQNPLELLKAVAH